MKKTIVFTTETPSTYEYDEVNKLIRRLNGRVDPTPRQGRDGEWRPVVNLTDVVVGARVLIEWPDSVPHAEGSQPGTLTTKVTSVAEQFVAADGAQFEQAQ